MKESTNVSKNQRELLSAIRNGLLSSDRSMAVWSKDEDQMLNDRYWDGDGISDLSLMLQRSESAVIQRLMYLDILTPKGKERPRGKSRQAKCHCPQCLEHNCSYYDDKGGCCNAGGI